MQTDLSECTVRSVCCHPACPPKKNLLKSPMTAAAISSICLWDKIINCSPLLLQTICHPLAKEEGFASFHSDGIANTSASYLLGGSTTLINNRFDLIYKTVVPSDKTGMDNTFLVNIGIDRHICFFYTELPFCFTSLLSDLRKSGRYDDLLALFDLRVIYKNEL